MMMNEHEFKHGEFVRASKKKKIGKDFVSERKVVLSDPKCIDWYEIDNDNTFITRGQLNTITRPLACGISILGISNNTWFQCGIS
jgi:hypothetical protein